VRGLESKSLQFLEDRKDLIFHPQFTVHQFTNSQIELVMERYEPRSRILDVGSGVGPYWPMRPDCNWVGLDIYPSNKETIVVTPGSTWDIPDASFDGVLCTQVLEHAFEFHLVLDEIHRVLRPDGILVVSVPFIYPYHGAPEDYHRFTEFAMDKHLIQFRILERLQLGNYFQTTTTLRNLFIEEKMKSKKILRFTRILFFPFFLLIYSLNNLFALSLASLDKKSIFPTGVLFVCKK